MKQTQNKQVACGVGINQPTNKTNQQDQPTNQQDQPTNQEAWMR
jgi:hypothetical protein